MLEKLKRTIIFILLIFYFCNVVKQCIESVVWVRAGDTFPYIREGSTEFYQCCYFDNGIRAASEIRFYQISDAIYYCDPLAVWHGFLTMLRYHFCQF